MDRVEALARYGKARVRTHVLDRQLCTAGEHVEHAVTVRHNDVSVRGGADRKTSLLQATALISCEHSRVSLALFVAGDHFDRGACNIKGCANGATTLDQQAVDIETGGHSGYHNAEVERGGVVNQRVYCVIADSIDREIGLCSGIHDQQALTLCENVKDLVTGGNVGRCTVRRGEHCHAIGQADLCTICDQQATVRVIHQHAGTNHIKAGADRTTTLNEQRIHIKTCCDAWHHDAQVECCRVIDQSMNGIETGGCNIEDRLFRDPLNDKARALGQNENARVSRRDHLVAIGDPSDPRSSFLQAVSWLESGKSSRECGAFHLAFIDRDRGASDIQSCAYGSTALDEKSIHIKTGGNAWLNNSKVKSCWVEDQRMDRVIAYCLHFESRLWTSINNDKTGTLGQHICDRIALRYIRRNTDRCRYCRGTIGQTYVGRIRNEAACIGIVN